MRSGFIYLLSRNDGIFLDANQSGLWWSSRAAEFTSSTLASAYHLLFGPSEVNPSYGPRVRWHGFPLRCLSTVLGMGRVGKLVITQH